jgi:hypothetical protein
MLQYLAVLMLLWQNSRKLVEGFRLWLSTPGENYYSPNTVLCYSKFARQFAEHVGETDLRRIKRTHVRIVGYQR